MGLATVIKRSKVKEQRLRLLVLGLDGAGKSSLVHRWAEDTPAIIAPTFGFRIITVRNRLHIWDVGGQQAIRQYWRNYFESTDGLVFVIDAADPGRISQSLSELSSLLCGSNQNRLCASSILVVANKSDAQNALSYDEILKVIRPLFDSIHGTFQWRLFSTSALEGTNCEAALDWLISDIDTRLGYATSQSTCKSICLIPQELI